MIEYECEIDQECGRIIKVTLGIMAHTNQIIVQMDEEGRRWVARVQRLMNLCELKSANIALSINNIFILNKNRPGPMPNPSFESNVDILPIGIYIYLFKWRKDGGSKKEKEKS